MKKFVLAIGAAAAIAAAASVTPAEAGFKGCCGGWNPHPHFGGGISIGLGLGVVDPGYGVGYGGCYTTYRKVLIPNIGIVMKKQLVCA
jgi:hypothetical protein